MQVVEKDLVFLIIESQLFHLMSRCREIQYILKIFRQLMDVRRAMYFMKIGMFYPMKQC